MTRKRNTKEEVYGFNEDEYMSGLRVYLWAVGVTDDKQDRGERIRGTRNKEFRKTTTKKHDR